MAMSMVIAAASQSGMSILIATERSGTTAATGSSTGALRSAATTTDLTAFFTVIAYLGTVFRSGFTVPITPTTIVGGCADRPSLQGVRVHRPRGQSHRRRRYRFEPRLTWLRVTGLTVPRSGSARSAIQA